MAGAAPTGWLAECPRATSNRPGQRHEYSKYRQADRQALYDPAHATVQIVAKRKAKKRAHVDADRHEGETFQHCFTIQTLRSLQSDRSPSQPFSDHSPTGTTGSSTALGAVPPCSIETVAFL